MTNKNLQYWQDCDAAIAKGPRPAPMPKAARAELLKGRKVVVYDSVKEGKGQVRPAPHKYNPTSAAAADRAGSETALGAAGIFKGMKNENRMNAKGGIQRGDDSAPQKRWKGKGTVDSPPGQSAVPASNPYASSSSAASRSAPHAMLDSGTSVSLIPADYGAPWNSSVWTDASWRTNEWQTTTSNDAEMPEHSCEM